MYLKSLFGKFRHMEKYLVPSVFGQDNFLIVQNLLSRPLTNVSSKKVLGKYFELNPIEIIGIGILAKNDNSYF